MREAKNFQFPEDMAHNLGIRRLPERTLGILSSLYDAEVRTLDDGCRSIEALLGREGILSPEGAGFLLVVTADHGENIGEHGLVDHKLSVADTLLHVPLVIHSPGRFEGGAAIPAQVRLQDLFPTLLEAAGAAVPGGLVLDGRSFLPQLRGGQGHPREWVFCHYDPRWGNRDRWKGRYARDHRFKLYLDGRLFDVSADELERAAIAPKDLLPNAAEARLRLQQVLDSMPAWVERTD